MTVGSFIVLVCALGGLIACAGFLWAVRTGQFTEAEKGRWLVFDDEDDVDRGTGAPGHR